MNCLWWLSEKELITCAKCKKNPSKYLEVDSKGEKLQVCENCRNEDDGIKKCDDCKIEVAYHHIQGTGIKGTLSLCKECNKKRENKDKSVGDVKDFDEKWNKWTFSYENQKPINKLDSLEKIQQAKNELEPYLKTPNIINKPAPYPPIQIFSLPIPIKTNEDVDKVINELKNLGIIKGKDDFMITPGGVVNIFYEKENEKEVVEQVKDFIKILDWKAQKLNKPTDKEKEPPQKDKNKPTDKGNKKPKPDELCERCGASCIVSETKTSYTIKRRRCIKHTVYFTREYSQWFGLNCGCIEKFKQENQQTCPQCKKHEFPDMKEGWMLDYEVKMAFCSAKCHVTYRELKWEEAQRLTQVQMMPPELDVEANPGQNTDWEKEGLKREVLFWRNYAKSLEQQLNNPNITPEERQINDYYRNLHRNTLRNAEQTYQSRYGTLNEDGTDKGKGMGGGMIFLIIIGAVALVGGIIFLLTRNKKSKK